MAPPPPSCAGLHNALDQQDALAGSGALSHLHVPISIIWGEKDQYLSPSLAAEIAALFPNPSVHLHPGAGHWPQHDQPDTVAELLKEPQTTFLIWLLTSITLITVAVIASRGGPVSCPHAWGICGR